MRAIAVSSRSRDRRSERFAIGAQRTQVALEFAARRVSNDPDTAAIGRVSRRAITREEALIGEEDGTIDVCARSFFLRLRFCHGRFD